MKEKESIRRMNKDHLNRYGEIYAAAFRGEPWFCKWKLEDAVIHVKEQLEPKQAFGLEYVIDDEIVGFILGSSILLDGGRAFDIKDLAVDPMYQRKGIGRKLLEELLSVIKEQGIAEANLMTFKEGTLSEFYNKFGFEEDEELVFMNKNL